ncbi:MAG: gliding motility-associated C-terminal domain-containing protein [Salinivirgaceae bacterium]|nr:gliding motility-associated C-terminal domain-containing protein [Salinivirgaceae bacterium]
MKRHIFTVSILLVAVQLFGQESRFWVGGSGKWSDTNHWSVTSGGEPGAALPESGTSVVFDENSFSGDKNTVSLNSAVTVGSLTATNANFVFSGKKDFTIGGSINTDNNADFGKLRGALVLSGSGDNTVSIASGLEGGIVIDGGSWTLQSDLTTEGNITLKSGSFNTNGFNVTCAVFSATENATALNIENSTVTCDKWDFSKASNLTFEAKGSEILIRNEFFKNFFSARNLTYNLVRSYDLAASKDPAPSLELTPIDVSCPSNADNLKNDGGVIVTVDGGVGDYNLVLGYLDAITHDFVWLDDYYGNGHPFENLEAGSYSAGFSPDGKKVTIQTVTVNYANPDFKINIDIKADAVCWGDDIELGYTASGGTGAGTYSQQWRKTGYLGIFSNAEQISAAPQASYAVTITDGAGCKFASASFSYAPWFRELGQNDNYDHGPARITGEASAEETCINKESGVITVSEVNGGTGPYTYSAKLGETTYNFPAGEASLDGLPAGEYTITITDKEGCTNRTNFERVYEDSSDYPEEIKVEITTIPAPEANAGSDDKVCLSEGTYTVKKAKGVEAKNYDKGAILWEVSDLSIATIASGADTETPTLNLLAAGTVTLTMTVSNGTCDDDSDDMELTIVATPKPVITSSDHPVCGLKEDIFANASMGGGLVADRAGGTGTGNVSVSGLHVEVTQPGEYIFRVIETEPEAGCVGYSDAGAPAPGQLVTLNFYKEPTVSFTPKNGETCGTTSVTIAPSIENQESISWIHDGNGTLNVSADSKSATYTPSGIDAGKEVTITVTVGNGVCTDKSDSYKLKVKPVPTVSINPIGTGSNGDFCGLSTTATAVPSLGGNLIWDNGGDNTFHVSPLTATTASISGDNGVTYGLSVVEEKDGCYSDPSPVVHVTFHDNPTLVLSDSYDVCVGMPATATATATNNTTLEWSKNDALYKGTLETTGTASSLVATYTPVDSDADKDVTLTATINSAACGSISLPYTFHVNKVPSPTLSGKEICGPIDDGYLIASITSGNTVEWIIPSGVKKAEEIIEGSEAKVKLALEGTTYGDYTIGVIESNANCSSNEVTVTVTFKAKPVMEFEEYTATICAGNPYTVKVKTHENYDNYIWTASDGGTVNMGTHSGTYNSVATTIGKKVTITATPTGGCTSEGAQSMTLTVNPNPAPNIDDVTVCGLEYTLPTPVQSVTFDPVSYPNPPTSAFAWSTPDATGKVHVVGDKFIATEEGKYTLHLAEMVGECQESDEAEITFVAKPTANAGTDDEICANEPTYTISAATAEHYSSLEWRSSSNPSVVFSSDLNPTYTIKSEDVDAGSVTLTLTAKSKTPCTVADDATSSITITIKPQPVPAISGDDEVCEGKPGTYSTDEGMSDYKWFVDDVEQTGETSPSFTYTWATAGPHKVSVSYNDGCDAAAPTPMDVTVHDLPASILPTTETSCTNGSVDLDATATGGSGNFTYSWTGNGASYLSDKNIANPTFSCDVAGTYTLTCTINDVDFGCQKDFEITIDNQQGPTANAGNDTTICYGVDYTIMGAKAEYGDVLWTSSGDGTFDNASNINATYTPGDSDKAAGSVTLTLTTTSATCGVATDDKVVTIMPELVIGIGTLQPFPISASTKIKVSVKGNYATAFGLQFYLVSPDGTHKVKLYNTIEDAPNPNKPWAFNAGNFDFTFTTESDVDFYNQMKNWGFGADVNGTFGITGSLSDIYGLNPAEGGWAVEVGSGFSDGVGKLQHAVISFTDVNFEGKTQTLTFDSKELNPAVSIPNSSTISYISPIGLRESCYGACDAHAVAKAIGGSGVIVKWEWARDINFTEEYYVGGTHESDTLDLCRGIYYVRVTDAMGCEAVTMVEVGSPDKIHINKDATTDVTCYSGSDGTVSFSATKELISHFDFDVAGYTATSSNDVSASFTTLPFGNKYKVIVTDEDGCQDSLDFSIGQPDTLMVTNTKVTLATSCTVNNGAVTFTVTGGKIEGDYHMEYMGLPQDQPDIVINQTTLTATGLTGASGIKFRIYDAGTFDPNNLNVGCYLDTTISTVAEGMTITLADLGNNLCSGDDNASITISVTNGSGDYTFEWSDGNGVIATTTEPTISGLIAGTYTVKVTDNTSFCDAISDPIDVVDPAEIVITKTITAMPKCFGEETASFSVSAVGGTGELSYAWQKDGVDYSNATSLENEGAGLYTVIVTDGFCKAYDTIEVIQPTSKLIITDVVSTESECATPTGTATAYVEGGSGIYTYTWTSLSDGSEWNGQSPVAMGADMYKLVVEDGLGCKVDSIVEVQDNGTLQLSVINKVGVLCLDRCTGSAELGLVYDEDNVYDNSELYIWWNGVQTDNARSNTLCNGINTVKVKSIANGCSKVDTFKLSDERALKVEIHRDPDLSTSGSCNGAITAIGKGGVPGYTYTWADASGNPIEADANEPNTIYLLCEGYYALHIEDNNPDGCSIDTLIQIEHRPLTYKLVQVSATACYGGSDGAIEIEGVGGYYEPYTYKWGSPMWPADSVAEGALITGLKAGKYGFTISQRNGTISITDTITVTQPTDSLLAQFVAIGTPCYETVGAISIKKTIGGNAPFTYTFSNTEWTDNIVKVSDDGKADITGLATDNYGLYVVDARGCEYKTIVEVPDLSEFRIELVAQETRCYGENSGEVSVTASSENGGFQYEWTGRTETTDRITSLTAGVYTVKVTDNKDCVKIDSIEVAQPEKINFAIANTKPSSCYNTTDAEIVIDTIKGRTGTMVKFHFMPEDGSAVCFDSTKTMSNVTFTELLPAGGYKVLAYDAKGCPSDTVSLAVMSERPEITISKIEDDEPNCYNYTADGKLSFGKITVTAIAMVNSQVSSTITDLKQYYQIDGGVAQEAHIFDKVTAGPHTITVGFGDTLLCPVVIEHELGSKSNLRANATFKNDEKLIFACPSDELTAKVTAAATFSSYKFYALTDEDLENEDVEEPQPTPAADTTSTNIADSTNVADSTIAYRFNRYIRFRDDSVPAADTTGTVSVDTTSTEEPGTVTIPEEKKPVYNHGKSISGEDVTLFNVEVDKDGVVWADAFMPYGGATTYYFEIADNQCVSIDSIRAITMRPNEKLTATVSMDDATSDELLIAGEYEVPEGGLLTLEANQLQFDNMPVEFVYSENALWTWDWAPANQLNAEGSGLRYESTNDGNPIVAQSFGKVIARVRDSVTFEVDAEFKDSLYSVTDLGCNYYDNVVINSISGIHPADVFTPNGDEYNETWKIEGLASYDNVTIYVFNRWGGRVWQYSGTGKDYSDANQWNGRNEKNKPVPSGTYYYVIQCSDGILGGKKVTGPVTVIR